MLNEDFGGYTTAGRRTPSAVLECTLFHCLKTFALLICVKSFKTRNPAFRTHTSSIEIHT